MEHCSEDFARKSSKGTAVILDFIAVSELFVTVILPVKQIDLQPEENLILALSGEVLSNHFFQADKTATVKNLFVLSCTPPV